MQSKVAAYVITLLSIVLPCLAFAKGDTVRIVIRGATLTNAIVISDPSIVHRFKVWPGAGSTLSSDSGGMNIDWSRGIAQPPGTLESYIVSFVTSR